MKARDFFRLNEALEPGAPFNVNALPQGWREIKTPAEMLEHTPWGQWWLAMTDHSHKPRRIRGEQDVTGIARAFQRDLDHGARIFFHFDEDNNVDSGVSVYNGRILEVAYAKSDAKPHRVDTSFVDRGSQGGAGEQWKGQDFSPLTDWKDQTPDNTGDALFAQLDPEFKEKFKKSWEKFNNQSDWRLSDDEYIALGLAIQRGVWPNGERMTPEEKIVARRRMIHGRAHGTPNESCIYRQMKARELFEMGAAPAVAPVKPGIKPGIKPTPFNPPRPAPGKFPSPSRRKFPGKREEELPKPKAIKGDVGMPPAKPAYESRASLIVKRLLA